MQNSKQEEPIGNILVVCTANKHRSPTAAFWIRIIEGVLNVWSRGSCRPACIKNGGTYCTQEDVDSAESIICMEDRNRNELIEAYGETISDKIRVLGIEDKYKKDDPKLVMEIFMKYKE